MESDSNENNSGSDYNSTIMQRLEDGKFVLIAEIGVNYYDIATKEGITPMEAAKLMVKEAKEAGIHILPPYRLFIYPLLYSAAAKRSV